MTDVENYSNLIEEIFGVGTTSFDKTKEVYNHVIGALNCSTDFFEFKANFTARLKRLKEIYGNEPSLLEQVNLIADVNNWEGAYAELAAYDKLNETDLLIRPIKLNIDVDKEKTFMLELGGKKANLDGFIEDYDIYFDVKCFKDNVIDILKGIYKEIESYFGFKHLHISEEYALDVSFDDFQNKRKDLLNELKNKLWNIIHNSINSISQKYDLNITCHNFKDKLREVSPEVRVELLTALRSLNITSITSDIIRNLSYKIMWDKGILTAFRTYHPHRHAENYHKLVFNYAKKFHKEKPSLIIFVVFPWYNLLVRVADDKRTNDENSMIYRLLARRVFCQYKHEKTLFKSFNSKFCGEQTMNEISNNLSGIIFLEDNTILSENPKSTNVKSYVYLNPNAKNPLRGLDIDYIHSICDDSFEDFEYDNY